MYLFKYMCLFKYVQDILVSVDVLFIEQDKLMLFYFNSEYFYYNEYVSRVYIFLSLKGFFFGRCVII